MSPKKYNFFPVAVDTSVNLWENFCNEKMVIRAAQGEKPGKE